MTPTKEQIALRALYDEFSKSNDFRPDSRVARQAKSALTAAREAERPFDMQTREQIIEAKWRGWFDEAVIEDRAATIERCAQVVGEFMKKKNMSFHRDELVAAIRALKDS